MNAEAPLGITGVHFHDLRGSGATWAAHPGATVAELMASGRNEGAGQGDRRAAGIALAERVEW